MKNASGHPSYEPPLPGLATSPRWFPHALDPLQDRVLLVERSEAEFRDASFLDDRSLTAAASRQVVPWQALQGAMPAEARRDAHYIFHIGHVGSTLISRLLGEHPGVLALREPMLLRTFHDVKMLQGRAEYPWSPISWGERLQTLSALLSRTFRPEQRAMVKATSSASELAAEVVTPGSRALLIFGSPRSYFENILAGDVSRQELHQVSGSRLVRLERRLGERPANLWDLDEGPKAALGWACEMTSLMAAADALPGDAVKWCDFDAFLRAPADGLAALAEYFGCPFDPAEADRHASGPIMNRYSKGPEHAYSPRLREEVLAQSRRDNRAAIVAAMDWLSGAAARYPQIARALERSGQD